MSRQPKCHNLCFVVLLFIKWYDKNGLISALILEFHVHNLGCYKRRSVTSNIPHRLKYKRMHNVQLGCLEWML